jgi:hypothetical protein
MGGEEPVNQMYDVWTLGCVYLELITWHLLGSKAISKKFNRGNDPQVLQGFQTLRRLEDTKQYDHVEDKFFNIDGERGPSVKGSVPKVGSSLAKRSRFPLLQAQGLIPVPSGVTFCASSRIALSSLVYS